MKKTVEPPPPCAVGDHEPAIVSRCGGASPGIVNRCGKCGEGIMLAGDGNDRHWMTGEQYDALALDDRRLAQQIRQLLRDAAAKPEYLPLRAKNFNQDGSPK